MDTFRHGACSQTRSWKLASLRSLSPTALRPPSRLNAAELLCNFQLLFRRRKLRYAFSSTPSERQRRARSYWHQQPLLRSVAFRVSIHKCSWKALSELFISRLYRVHVTLSSLENNHLAVRFTDWITAKQCTVPAFSRAFLCLAIYLYF